MTRSTFRGFFAERRNHLLTGAFANTGGDFSDFRDVLAVQTQCAQLFRGERAGNKFTTDRHRRRRHGCCRFNDRRLRPCT